MTTRQLSELIPAEYRREILELNIINTAIAQPTDPSMQYLGKIWKEYIEKDFAPDCPLCYTRVLDNLKQMQKHFIEIERETKLLDQL
jgi:hypothetical protein